MLKLRERKRENLCVDCNDPKCLHAGQAIADCPMWRCEREGEQYEDCESCGLIRIIQREARRKKNEHGCKSGADDAREM